MSLPTNYVDDFCVAPGLWAQTSREWLCRSEEIKYSVDSESAQLGYITLNVNEVKRVIKITYVVNLSGIAGVGTYLLELAFKESLSHETCQGKLELDSIDDAHFFYWKLGFRPEAEMNMAAIYEKYKDNTAVLKLKARTFQSLEMHLPETEIARWKAKMAFKAVLRATLENLPFSTCHLIYDFLA